MPDNVMVLHTNPAYPIVGPFAVRTTYRNSQVTTDIIRPNGDVLMRQMMQVEPVDPPEAAKTIARSYQPCECTDQQPSALPLPCGCVKCVTCGGYTHWAHHDSL